MKTHHARTMAVVLTLSLVAGTVCPARAQRRRGEPEANPQFQQQTQGGSAESGAPIDNTASAPASASSSEEAVPRSVQGVRIGTAASPRPASAAPFSPLDTRVTVRVKGASLETFLDAIHLQSDLNFIISEGLENKKVTASLHNVTVREALQILLEIKGLNYQRIGRSNTYVVAPRSKEAVNLITRIYTLSYIPLIPLGDMGQDQAAISPTFGTGGGAGGQEGGGSRGGGSQNQASSVAILDVLKSVLSKKKGDKEGAGGGGGQVAVDPRTNSLIVTDIPEVFPQVEQIIYELDRKPPQVMIEAQIVEIDSSRAKELGFEWGGAHGELASFTGGQRDTAFPLNLTSKLSNTHFFDPVTNVISAVGGSAGASNAAAAGSGATTSLTTLMGNSLKTGMVDLTSLKVTLRAMVSRSEGRFLGKPKILTLNNKSAVIQIASNQAVGMQVTNSGGTSLNTQTSSAERVNTGLILKVTPQVNKDGYITMLVQPSFTDVSQSNISTSLNPVFDPVSRGASSLVRIRNGQTLVMGGLLRSTENKVVRKVPILGYIPIIGWFFTSVSSQRVNSDLVIFLTPTIVND